MLAELGFLGMRVPESHGGLGLDTATYLLVLEELAWGDAAVALSVSIQNGPVATMIAEVGTEEQKERFLPRLADGALLGAFALSEPEAGSDVAGVRTRAERSGDEWTLTGTKKWVTNGDRADVVVVFARTPDGTAGEVSDRSGIGAFLVDRRADGYRVARRERTMGLRASETVEVRLEGVRVPSDRVLGETDRGLEYGLRALDVGRLGGAALSVGVARAALEHASAYANERHQFDRPIGEFGGVQEKLAGMATRITGARALVHESGRRLEGESDGGSGAPGADASRAAACAMAKLAASEAAMEVADEAVQIFGGYGYMRDYPVEKLLRDAKGTEIYDGTSEMMRRIVAEDVLRRAPDEG